MSDLRIRLRNFTTITSLVLITLVATACGSDGDGETTTGPAGSQAPTPGPQLSTSEYFDRVSAAFSDLELAVAASANPGGEITSPEQLLPAIQDAMTGLEQAIPPFIAEMRSLNPPDQVAEAHRNFISALEKDQSDIAALAEEVRQASSLTEATNAFASRKGALVESREPCEALQQIAEHEGVSVDLPCEE